MLDLVDTASYYPAPTEARLVMLQPPKVLSLAKISRRFSSSRRLVSLSLPCRGALPSEFEHLVQLAGSVSSIDFLLQRWPVALTRLIPDRTRSWIIDRSNSAKTPITPNSALPAGVVVSMPC